MVVVRGVSALSGLGIVSVWWSQRHELIMIGWPWWKPQKGQASIEYGLMLAVGGGLVLALWSMLGLTVTEWFWLVVHVLFGGCADWFRTGLF
jgi:Flp pilus assembly pilin Flp